MTMSTKPSYIKDEIRKIEGMIFPRNQGDKNFENNKIKN